MHLIYASQFTGDRRTPFKRISKKVVVVDETGRIQSPECMLVTVMYRKEVIYQIQWNCTVAIQDFVGQSCWWKNLMYRAMSYVLVLSIGAAIFVNESAHAVNVTGQTYPCGIWDYWNWNISRWSPDYRSHKEEWESVSRIMQAIGWLRKQFVQGHRWARLSGASVVWGWNHPRITGCYHQR